MGLLHKLEQDIATQSTLFTQTNGLKENRASQSEQKGIVSDFVRKTGGEFLGALFGHGRPRNDGKWWLTRLHGLNQRVQHVSLNDSSPIRLLGGREDTQGMLPVYLTPSSHKLFGVVINGIQNTEEEAQAMSGSVAKAMARHMSFYATQNAFPIHLLLNYSAMRGPANGGIPSVSQDLVDWNKSADKDSGMDQATKELVTAGKNAIKNDIKVVLVAHSRGTVKVTRAILELLEDGYSIEEINQHLIVIHCGNALPETHQELKNLNLFSIYTSDDQGTAMDWVTVLGGQTEGLHNVALDISATASNFALNHGFVDHYADTVGLFLFLINTIHRTEKDFRKVYEVLLNEIKALGNGRKLIVSPTKFQEILQKINQKLIR